MDKRSKSETIAKAEARHPARNLYNVYYDPAHSSGNQSKSAGHLEEQVDELDINYDETYDVAHDKPPGMENTKVAREKQNGSTGSISSKSVNVSLASRKVDDFVQPQTSADSSTSIERVPTFTLGASEQVVSFEDDDEPFDPCCDPDNPVTVHFANVADAYARIRRHVVQTPFTRSRLSEALGMDLYFKKEFMQFTGSFKDRGAIFTLLNLPEAQLKKGVVTTSAGNHAQALAHQGRKLKVPVTVVMPKTAPLVKINSCQALEANVILHGERFDEAMKFALRLAKRKGLFYVNGYDHKDIIAGQGTVGIEMLEKVPDLDYVIVPVGGGGLIAGITKAVKKISPKTKIIGVESEVCPSWTTAIENGRPIPCEASKFGAIDSISDGLSVIKVGVNAFETCHKLIDKMILISEDYISLAILRLLEHEKSVVEGAGAAGLAAILSSKLPELKGKKVGCVLCGGNIDVNVLGRVIDRACLMDRRLCRFKCVISDRSGGLTTFLKIISDCGASVREILHDRMNLPSNIFRTVVRVVAEIRNASHEEQLRLALMEEYPDDLLEWDKGAWGQAEHGSHYNVLKLLRERKRTVSGCSSDGGHS